MMLKGSTIPDLFNAHEFFPQPCLLLSRNGIGSIGEGKEIWREVCAVSLFDGARLFLGRNQSFVTSDPSLRQDFMDQFSTRGKMCWLPAFVDIHSFHEPCKAEACLICLTKIARASGFSDVVSASCWMDLYVMPGFISSLKNVILLYRKKSLLRFGVF